MEFFEKIEQRPKQDLSWNIPESKQGTVNIIGGNSQSFRAVIKTAEFMGDKYPIKKLNVILPDALKNKLPEMPNFVFLPSTKNGAFATETELVEVLNNVDFNLIIGDLSRNTETIKAVASACQIAEKPIILTRDTVDAVGEMATEQILMKKNIILLTTMPQLQKIFRAVFYPKILLLTQSLVQVVEALHKFTLSYDTNIITLHDGQILIASGGKVKAVPLEKSGFSAIMFWQGEMAAKIAAFNLYNPHDFISATLSAIFS